MNEKFRQIAELVKCLSRSEEYSTVLTVLSRVLTAKPHSADVERCISANNLMKTSLRLRLNLGTEKGYLFIYHNLPPSAAWDPRPAVLSWLMQKSRRTKDPKKGKAQRHFRNVFPEAHGSDNRLSSSDDDEQKDHSNTGAARLSAKENWRKICF